MALCTVLVTELAFVWRCVRLYLPLQFFEHQYLLVRRLVVGVVLRYPPRALFLHGRDGVLLMGFAQELLLHVELYVVQDLLAVVVGDGLQGKKEPGLVCCFRFLDSTHLRKP